MINIRYIIPLMALFLTFCSQEEDTTKTEYPDILFRTEEIDQEADIFIISDQMSFSSDTSPDIRVQATFRNINNKSVYAFVNSFLINDVVINPFSLGNKKYYSNNNIVTQVFGNTIDVEVIGNSNFPTFARPAMTLPKLIKLQPLPYTLSRTQNFTLNWNADSGNSEDVLIIFWYKGEKSHDIDPSLPIEDKTVIITANDTGSYTVNSSNFSDFPINGLVDVIILRGRQEVITVDAEDEIEVIVHAAILMS